MPLFAHIESGFCVDVHDVPDIETYTKRFADEFADKWLIIEVDDGTLPGATIDKNGKPIPGTPKPAVVVPPSSPPQTTKQQIIDQVAALKSLVDQM